MYVMSEDGRRLPPFYIRNVEHVEGADTYRIVYTDAHVSTIVTSDYNTEEAAKARLADVRDWLNALDYRTVLLDKMAGMIDAASVQHHGCKPTVYEFGRPIGYWRQP